MNKAKKTRKDKIQHNKKKETPKKVSNKLEISLAIIVGLLGFVLYSNTFTHGFALDDYSVMKENYVVKQGTDGIKTILTTNYRYGYWGSKGVMYRPLSLVMFATEWEFFYDEDTVTPGASHFINVLLYALSGFLLFILLRKILKDYNIVIPFIGALLFIAHPIHTEVVANVKSRDEILCFFFVILSILYLWKNLDKSKLVNTVLSLTFFLLAFLSKENTVTFVGVIPLLLFFFTQLPYRKIIGISALYIIPTGIYLFMRWSILDDLNVSDAISVADNLLVAAHGDLSRQLPTAILILGKYLLLLLFPHPLSSDYSYNQIPLTNIGDYRVLISLVVYLAMGAVAIAGVYFRIKRRKNPEYSKNWDLLSFGLLFFFATFSLYSNILFLIGSSMGDRFLFVSSLGFALLLTLLLSKVFRITIHTPETSPSLKEFAKNYSALLAVAGILVVAYGFKTIERNQDWKNNYSLYSTDVKRSPNSTHINYHYGLSVMKDMALNAATNEEKMAYLDTAITYFKKAIEIYPYYDDVYEQLGLAYFRKNEYDNALKYYEEALKRNPSKARAYSNMGKIYFDRKNYDKALELYETAVKYDPRFSDAWMNLGSTYGTVGKFDKAISAFLTCLKYDPNNAMVHYFLYITYQTLNNFAEANKHLNRVKELDPSILPKK